MLKFLIILAFLVGSSFVLTEAFSLEIEFQIEEERIKESMGWIDTEKVSFEDMTFHLLLNRVESLSSKLNLQCCFILFFSKLRSILDANIS